MRTAYGHRVHLECASTCTGCNTAWNCAPIDRASAFAGIPVYSSILFLRLHRPLCDCVHLLCDWFAVSCSVSPVRSTGTRGARVLCVLVCSVCLWSGYSLCAVPVCGPRVRSPCAVPVCGPRVRSPCAVPVCGPRVRSPCAVPVCGPCVRSPCAVPVCGPRVRSPCAVPVCTRCK
jgi:hypothetical protein